MKSSQQVSLSKSKAQKQSASRVDNLSYATQPPVSSTELRRFKTSAWIVLAFGVVVGFLIFRYGDAPRPFVEWLTAFILAPMVTAMFVIMGYALLRFGRACRKYESQDVHIDKSGETFSESFCPRRRHS